MNTPSKQELTFIINQTRSYLSQLLYSNYLKDRNTKGHAMALLKTLQAINPQDSEYVEKTNTKL